MLIYIKTFYKTKGREKTNLLRCFWGEIKNIEQILYNMIKEDSFLDRTYRENTDNIKLDILVKNFKEIQSFLKLFEKKFKNITIFNIKVQIEINWKDKSCRF